MKVLIGTSNPSKVERFKSLLEGYDLEFLSLKDLNITSEPEENGITPKENAIIKAKYYSSFCDVVICNDSGLYFQELDVEDSRQPGLNIRTPNGNKRLDDEEMIEYYSSLIRTLGGKVNAYYLDGIAVSINGNIFSFMEELSYKTDTFIMVDKASNKRHKGWPLDSLSIRKNTNKYFVDETVSDSKDNIFVNDYRKRLINFLVDTLKQKKDRN